MLLQRIHCWLTGRSWAAAANSCWWIGLLLSALCAVATASTYEGKLVVLTEAHGNGVTLDDTPPYLLWVTNGPDVAIELLYILQFDVSSVVVGPLEDLMTGRRIQVTSSSDPTTGVLLVESLLPLLGSSGTGLEQASSESAVQSGQSGALYPVYPWQPSPDGSSTFTIRSVTWVVSELCGAANVVSAEQVRQLYFGPQQPLPKPPSPPRGPMSVRQAAAAGLLLPPAAATYAPGQYTGTYAGNSSPALPTYSGGKSDSGGSNSSSNPAGGYGAQPPPGEAHHMSVHINGGGNSTGNGTHVHCERGDSNGTMTLAGMWRSCSYGGTLMPPDVNLVMELPLPCGGLAGGIEFNSSQCGVAELMGWMQYALLYTQDVLGTDASSYARRIMLLPPNSSCGAWIRKSTLGCDTLFGCDTWLRGDAWPHLKYYLAELGHTLGLRHALSSEPLQQQDQQQAGAVAGVRVQAQAPGVSAAPRRQLAGLPRSLLSAASLPMPRQRREALVTWQPMDPSCPMGSMKGGYRCYNAPHSYQLGFQSYLAQLSSTSNFLGMWVSVQLPPAQSAAANQLRVVPNWFVQYSAPPPPLDAGASAQPVQYYLQYRVAEGGDAGLLPSLDHRVTLHSYALVDSSGGPGPPPLLLAHVAVNETFRETTAKFVVRFASVAPSGAASVQLCRYLWDNEVGNGEGCYDGSDTDCDGLVDYDDPDCAGW